MDLSSSKRLRQVAQGRERKQLLQVLQELNIESEILLERFAESSELQCRAKNLGLSERVVSLLKKSFKPKRFEVSLWNYSVCIENDIYNVCCIKPFISLPRLIRPLILFMMLVLTCVWRREMQLKMQLGVLPANHVEELTKFSQQHICNATSLSVANLRFRNDSILNPKVFKRNANGYVCVIREFEYLYSWNRKFEIEMNVLLNGLWFAKSINRTLVAPPLVSALYDVKKLDECMFPASEHPVVVPFESNLCESGVAEGVANAVKVKQKDLSEPHFLFTRAFHQYLAPTGYFEHVIKGFIYGKFNVAPFAAVWVANNVNLCKATVRTHAETAPNLCMVNETLTNVIVARLMLEKDPPIFLFSNAEVDDFDSVPHWHTFDIHCPPHACAMIKAEIAGSQPFFMSKYISRLRLTRQLRSGVFYPNILRWDENLEMSEKNDPYYFTWFNVSGERNGLWKGRPQLFQYDDVVDDKIDESSTQEKER